MSGEVLSIAASIAEVVTAFVAAFAFGKYMWDRRQRRCRLEVYLKAELDKGKDDGKRTLLHLVARLGLTEAEIVDASFRSKLIRRYVSPDLIGHAAALLLRYEPPSN